MTHATPQRTTPRLATRPLLLALPLATVTLHLAPGQHPLRATEVDFGLSVGISITDTSASVQKSSISPVDLLEIQEALGIDTSDPDTYLRPQSSLTGRGSRQPLVSAFLQIRLTDRLSVNPELIFQRAYETGLTIDASSVGPPTRVIPTKNPLAFGRTHTTINVWEFPVLVKYNLTKSARSPFVAAGPTFWIENSGTLRSRSSDPHYGVAAAFGYNLPWRRWRLTPQLRYTRWAGRGYALISHDYSSGLPKNQLRAMLGFTF